MRSRCMGLHASYHPSSTYMVTLWTTALHTLIALLSVRSLQRSNRCTACQLVTPYLSLNVAAAGGVCRCCCC
jgi:hypothetical protein